MKKKRKKKKLLLYNLGNKIKAPSCVRASGPLAESRRQAFGPYCWIRGRTQPVYIYIYPRRQANEGCNLLYGEGSPVGYRPPVLFVWFVEATTEKSPLVRRLCHACLFACRSMTDDSRPTLISSPRRTETNFYQSCY